VDGLESALDHLHSVTADTSGIQDTNASVHVWSPTRRSWISTDVKLDTGASTNFVTANFLRQYIQVRPRAHPGGHTYNCKTVTGQQPIIGYVNLLFTASQDKNDTKYHRHVNFDVIETPHSPFGNLLLGIDFLLETKVVTMDKTALLNVKDKTLLWLVKEPARPGQL